MFDNLMNKFKNVFKKSDNQLDVKVKREHIGIGCNVCKCKYISGDRFCCTLCTDYNLCSECFCSNLSNKKHEPNHPCLLITYPQKDTHNTELNLKYKLDYLINEYKDKMFNISCDLCNKNIQGVYLKCNKCYCTFMCLECWRSDKHDKSHPIIIYNTVRLEKINLDDLKLVKMLDNGNFGFVYESILKQHNQLVACKLMNKKSKIGSSFKAKFEQKQQKQKIQEQAWCIDKELEAYIEVFSPYVCKLLGYGRDQTSRIFLVMEYLENGSLEDYMIKSKKANIEIPLLLKLRIMSNIASGLADIHSKNFIHADIKPKNILLDSDLIAKICDLGSVKNINLNYYDNNTGGLYYLPMEFFQGKYDNRIDIYSFGLIFYHLMSGHRHTYQSNNLLVINKISKISLNFVRMLILKATHVNPFERKTILYYRNIIHVYLKLLEDLLRMFNLTNLSNNDMFILVLNNYLLDIINSKYDCNLELNTNIIYIDNLKMKSIDKENLKKACDYLTQIKQKSIINNAQNENGNNQLKSIENSTRQSKFYQ